MPLLLYHFQKITMIDDSLKYGTKGETIMSTKCCRKSNNGNLMGQAGRFEVDIWTPDVRIKMRKYFAIAAVETTGVGENSEKKRVDNTYDGAAA